MSIDKAFRPQMRNINTGEAVTQALLEEIGSDAQVAAWDAGLAPLFSSVGSSTAFNTTAGGFIGRGFHPKLGGSALTVTIEPGAGFYNRETTASLDPTTETYLHSPMLIPLRLLAAATATIGAHHATLPRYDIITVAVSEVDDDSDSVRERTAGPGTQAVATRNTRSTWTPAFTVTAGTANASPTVPSTPAGGLLVAVVYVPATSGNVIVRDARAQVQFGYGLGEPTYPYYAYPAVQSGLGVTAGSGLTVSVASGYTGSPRRIFEATTLTLTVSVVDPVIHLIYANGSDGVAVAFGTPAATPAEPALPTGATALAYVTLAASAASISSGDIENITARGPYKGQMDDVPTVFPRLTVAAASAGSRTVTVQAVDRSGNEVLTACDFKMEMLSAGVLFNGIGSPSVGSTEFADALGRKVIRTDATGQAVVAIGTATGTVALVVTPTRYLVATPTTATIAPRRERYRPGGPVDAFVQLT